MTSLIRFLLITKKIIFTFPFELSTSTTVRPKCFVCNVFISSVASLRFIIRIATVPIDSYSSIMIPAKVPHANPPA